MMTEKAAVQKERRSNVNELGLTKADYRGRPSTLCQGCGHNSIANQIINACYEASIPPEFLIKLSGIGCSSKSPAYFMSRSHGFNSLHGRMPPIATGALMANSDLKAIGVSGDGDTASIGIGHFIHLLRRNVPMVYIIENNGVYGLTKGQFSATADKGQVLKTGINPFMPVDLCLEALAANCGFIARSFAGDPKQVKELIKAALSYRGTAVLDIISPCVTFNNRDESTKSYTWGKTHEDPLHDVTWVPKREEISLHYKPGEVKDVEMHDGSCLRLKKLEQDYDPTNRSEAMRMLDKAYQEHILVTGLIYFSKAQPSLQETEQMISKPLVELDAHEVRPDRRAFNEMLANFR